MNDPGQWLWGLLLLFLHWLWSIRVLILIGVAFVFAEKQIKEMLTEAYTRGAQQDRGSSVGGDQREIGRG